MASHAQAVLAELIARGQSVATGESLTGGLVVAALTEVPGASAAVRGGACVYHNDLKTGVLGVDPAVLAAGGAVQPEVARQLALGARRVFAATWGIGTTGVAGPGPADGAPSGTVHIAVAGPHGVHTRALALPGGRHHVRAATVDHALALMRDTLSEDT